MIKNIYREFNELTKLLKFDKEKNADSMGGMLNLYFTIYTKFFGGVYEQG